MREGEDRCEFKDRKEICREVAKERIKRRWRRRRRRKKWYNTVVNFYSLPSAGVGRTGTFICIDNVLEQIKKEKVVDISGAINKMRHQRMKMVQTAVSSLYQQWRMN